MRCVCGRGGLETQMECWALGEVNVMCWYQYWSQFPIINFGSFINWRWMSQHATFAFVIFCWVYGSLINPITEGGAHCAPPPTKYRFKSGDLGARTPQTHWLFLNMYEKWYPNVFGVISLRGPPMGPFFSGAPWKNTKIYSFWAKTIVFTSKWTIFSPGI